jgi:hypothetical protein
MIGTRRRRSAGREIADPEPGWIERTRLKCKSGGVATAYSVESCIAQCGSSRKPPMVLKVLGLPSCGGGRELEEVFLPR